MDLAWWQWIVGGLLLTLAELMVPALFLVWFGIGAILVGLILLVLPITLAAQFTLWAVASCAMVLLWFRVVKNPDRTKAGIAKDAFLGETGLITKEVSELGKGEIRFQKPILGSEVWPVIADESIKAGERAQIIDVLGQTLKVARK
jgi:membrane protein implicated in regulation of membrane protease activity